MRELHSANPQVLHRDLNPGNIRLAEGGRVVVTDFGVARTEGQPSAYVDQEGPIFNRGVGAPEQWAGETADVRTDIYQLGALLLVMLTGKYPNQDGAELLVRRMDVPGWLTQAIQRCLQRDRAERFQTVADLTDALLSSSAPEADWPGAPGGFDPPQPHGLWEFPLQSPNWRTTHTPVAESPEGCYVWDRRTLHRLDPATGASIWSWTSGQEGPTAEIRDGTQSPAVQAEGQLLYLRHGKFLCCLRPSDGTRLWRYEHWSDITGAYLLANGLIVLDSYRAEGAGLLGPAALDAATGRLAWHLEEPQFHVVSMAATYESLVLVECRGIGGIGGSRVRLVDLSRGETLAVQELAGPGESERAIAGVDPSGLFRPRRPLIMADGSIVVWANNRLSGRQEIFCFDSHLVSRWTKSVQVENTQSQLSLSPSPFLVGAGENLLSFRAEYGGAKHTWQGWVARVKLRTGELCQEKSLPENGVPLSAAVTPDGSVVFVVVRQQDKDKKKSGLWRRMALKPDTGEMSYPEPGGELPGDLSPLALMATSSHLYLQVPLAQTRRRPRAAGNQGPGFIATFQWQ